MMQKLHLAKVKLTHLGCLNLNKDLWSRKRLSLISLLSLLKRGKLQHSSNFLIKKIMRMS